MSGPDLLGTIASLYGVGAASAALLQARQIVRRGSSCEVSARFFATYTGGYAIWLLYGLSIGSVPLVLVDAAGMLCGLITLAVTLRLRGSLARPNTWRNCPDSATNGIDDASYAGQPPREREVRGDSARLSFRTSSRRPSGSLTHCGLSGGA
jgi:uncharacterized protein with PQ loop repeat